MDCCQGCVHANIVCKWNEGAEVHKKRFCVAVVQCVCMCVCVCVDSQSVALQ